MKLIVAGSRTFNDYSFIKEKLDYLLQNVKEPIEVVCGKSKGVDELGEIYAKEKGYSVKEFPADWDGLGKSAGPARNRKMADYATHCICFWDGVSRGTKNMIELCKMKNIPCKVIRI